MKPIPPKLRLALGLLCWTATASACQTCNPQEAPSAPTTTEPRTTDEPSNSHPARPVPLDEACASVIVVAWERAQAAPETVERDELEARTKVETLLSRLEAGESFPMLARTESDAASSRLRGGLLGTYRRDEWPVQHRPILDAVFALRIREISEPIRAPYGWVLAQRCPIEKIHTRHILIRYRGALHAVEDLARNRNQARSLIEDIRARVDAPGMDFAELAREFSEDASANAGGDLGTLGRGRLENTYETAAFALDIEEISEVIESPYGFHIIQRLPLPSQSP